MAEHETADASWLPVIGKALCYLCLSQAMERDPEKYNSVLAKVKFLQGLGLSPKDAALAAGSSANSVGVLKWRKKGKNGSAKKKGRRGR